MLVLIISLTVIINQLPDLQLEEQDTWLTEASQKANPALSGGQGELQIYVPSQSRRTASTSVQPYDTETIWRPKPREINRHE